VDKQRENGENNKMRWAGQVARMRGIGPITSGRDQLGDICLDGKIILKWILQ
jgi:hypothetical protein